MYHSTNGVGTLSSRSTAAGPRSVARRRDARAWSPELQQARLTGGPVQGAGRDHEREAGQPAEGVSVARGRLEVRFDGAENALERLFALAQALGNDYVRFEELVGRGGRQGRGGDGMTTEALVPAARRHVPDALGPVGPRASTTRPAGLGSGIVRNCVSVDVAFQFVVGPVEHFR